MIRLIFGRDFVSENEGFCVRKLLHQKECGYNGGVIEFPCKYYLHAPKKYMHSMRNAIRQKQRSYGRCVSMLQSNLFVCCCMVLCYGK